MAFTLRFKTSNAAFMDQSAADGEEDHAAARAVESALILRTIARRLDDGATEGTVRDSNGNTVGEWKLRKD